MPAAEVLGLPGPAIDAPSLFTRRGQGCIGSAIRGQQGGLQRGFAWTIVTNGAVGKALSLRWQPVHMGCLAGGSQQPSACLVECRLAVTALALDSTWTA